MMNEPKESQTELVFIACDICDTYASDIAHVRHVNGRGQLALAAAYCQLCRLRIEEDLRKYRPHCRYWYWDDESGGWRASHTYRPDACLTDAAVDVEIVRLAGRPWRTVYLERIEGRSTYA